MNSENFTPEDFHGKKTPQIKDFETRWRKKIRDSEMHKSPKNETSRPIKNACKNSRSCQNFARPQFFEVAFNTPLFEWFD